MKYVVHITEILARNIIVEAEDEQEAYDKAESLCCNDTVCLVCEDFADRNIEVLGKPDEDDEQTLQFFK